MWISLIRTPGFFTDPLRYEFSNDSLLVSFFCRHKDIAKFIIITFLRQPYYVPHLLGDQIIWDEVGEPETERDKMLLELEQECLEVYRRRVDYANRCRAQLRQAIADSEAELAAICSAMGERPVHIRQVSVTYKLWLNKDLACFIILQVLLLKREFGNSLCHEI